jgi:DNA-binding transcriptional MerR regulator
MFGSLLTVSEIARLAGLHPELVERLISLGLVDPVDTQPEPLFEPAVILRLRRIVRLRNDLGVNWAGVGVVLDLLGRIEELQEELASLKATRPYRR